MDLQFSNILSGSLAVSKSAAAQLAQRQIDLVRNGDVDPLAYYLLAKFVDELMSNITSHAEVKNAALTEAAKHSDGFKINGAVISVMGTAKYDYSNTAAWVELEGQIRYLKAQQEAIQNFAKALPGPIGTMVTTDGEEITVHRPVKTVADTIKTVLPK
jgi:hypothetical protein